MSIGGDLLGAANQASAARRQNRVFAGGQREQNRAGMESSGELSALLSRLRTSAPNPAVEQGMFSAALGPAAVSGPGGAQFQADAARAAAGARGYGQDLASLFARIRAPGLQRQREAEMFMDTGNALRPINMRAEDAAFLTNLRAGSKQPNPWLGMLGTGLSNAGSYMVSNG